MNKKIYFLFMLMLFIANIIYSEDLTFIEKQYQEISDSWINGEIDSDQILDSLRELEKRLNEDKKSSLPEYWKSRIALLNGQIYFDLGKKKDSIIELEKCLDLAASSIELDERSDSWRLKSEAGSLLLIQKGFLYTVANYAIVKDHALRALELDSENARASLVYAQLLCQAPPVAGGNLNEGLDLLNTLLLRDDLSREDRFVILQSLSMIYFDNKREEDAKLHCQLALSLYPGNRGCVELLSEIIYD